MRKSNLRTILALALVLVLSLVCFTGCAQPAPSGTDLSTGGVLCLKVNPEIAITYDANGNVTAVEARNEDAKKILENYTGFEGKACKEVVSELVATIGDAGYFVEEIEGGSRKIVIEIEPGSALPSGTFLDDVVAEVQTQVNNHNWSSPVNIEGYTDYGVTDYNDTDYGPNNDGITDYNDTDYGPNNDGVTDYLDTDYGPNADGITDYTDYGTTPPATEAAATVPAATAPSTGSTSGGSNAGRTDYTDYGTTDYNDTDYGPNNDGVTDYGRTDYGTTDYGKTDYGTDYGD